MRSIASSSTGGQSRSLVRRRISSTTSRFSVDERRSKESKTICAVSPMHFDSFAMKLDSKPDTGPHSRAGPVGPAQPRETTRTSTHRPLHLELDQLVHLDGVLHRQLLDQGLDEAADDQGRGLGLGEAAAHQIEELL